MKMYNKKLLIIIGIILIIVIIVFPIILIKNNGSKEKNKIEEYTPQKEITDAEIRKTIISLYFKHVENNKLTPESICIDVKELKDNPYKTLVNFLIKGPENKKLESAIPENTKINDAYLKGDIVYLDFSKEFIDNAPKGIEEETLIVYSIVNTLTELNEVNGVRILINGEKDKEFIDGKINFKETFYKNS